MMIIVRTEEELARDMQSKGFTPTPLPTLPVTINETTYLWQACEMCGRQTGPLHEVGGTHEPKFEDMWVHVDPTRCQ